MGGCVANGKAVNCEDDRKYFAFSCLHFDIERLNDLKTVKIIRADWEDVGLRFTNNCVTFDLGDNDYASYTINPEDGSLKIERVCNYEGADYSIKFVLDKPNKKILKILSLKYNKQK